MIRGRRLLRSNELSLATDRSDQEQGARHKEGVGLHIHVRFLRFWLVGGNLHPLNATGRRVKCYKVCEHDSDTSSKPRTAAGPRSHRIGKEERARGRNALWRQARAAK